MASQTLRICLTGGSSGVGLQLCKRLVGAGHTVVLLTRNDERTQATLSTLPAQQQPLVRPVVCADLADFAAVRAAAAQIRAAEPHLDVLVLNAGIMNQSIKAINGIEATLATNHLGQFLLLSELLPLLSAAPAPRVVLVSSELHKRVPPTVTSLPTALFSLSPALAGQHGVPKEAPKLSGRQVYGISKLYNAWTAQALARRAQRAGLSKLWVAAVTPGFIPTTGLSRDVPWIGRFAMRYLLPWLHRTTTVEEGAERVEHVTLSPDAPGSAASGAYWAKGQPDVGSEASKDEVAAEQLWGLSMTVLGVKDFLGPAEPAPAAK